MSQYFLPSKRSLVTATTATTATITTTTTAIATITKANLLEATPK